MDGLEILARITSRCRVSREVRVGVKPTSVY